METRAVTQLVFTLAAAVAWSIVVWHIGKMWLGQRSRRLKRKQIDAKIREYEEEWERWWS